MIDEELGTESGAQTRIRLAFAGRHHQMWRNNSGAFKDEKGRWVRYGLCNDSASLNKKIKSSDLVGATTITITKEMVGKTIGVFTAVETKKPGWNYSLNDDRAVAQDTYHEIVRKAGGIAGFARSAEEALDLVSAFIAKMLR